MRRQDAAAALLFIGLSIAMTWPLTPNLGRAVSDPGDPFINTWILDWDYYATFHARPLFHANAFHPARYSLAYSENLYGLALLLFPLRLLGAGALAAYNIAMLAGFAFCGYAAYLLGSRLTSSWMGGMAAGVFYAFLPFRFIHVPHVQHVWGGWLPLLLLCLVRYAQLPTRRRAIAFAAVFLMNGLTNIHYLLFGAFAAGVTALLLLPRSQWRELAMATGVALLILAPFLYPYAAVAKLYGMQRGVEEVARFSAVARDWLPGQATEAERKLYPGVLAYVATLAAPFLARRRKPQLALAFLWIAIGFLGSLGFHTEFHKFLFGAVPGFRAIRVPARWAVIAYIGMSMLIALVTARLTEFLGSSEFLGVPRRRPAPRAEELRGPRGTPRNWPRAAAALVPIAFVATLWAAPIRWYLIDPERPEVYRWLAKQNVRGVAELPMDSFSSDYEYMLRATAHHKPIVNGVSGFAPPLRVQLSELSRQEPIPDALVDKLHEADVDTLILHADFLGAHAPFVREWLQRELARGRLTFAGKFHSRLVGDFVFHLPREPRRAAVPQVLNAFLHDQPPCGTGTMGALDFPQPMTTFHRRAIFSGWTLSPHGIQSVDLWFDNRTYRHRAQLVPDPSLNARCAGDPRVTRTRYWAAFDHRPDAIRRDTDVQVEVTDGRGEKTVFDDRWITWE
ncbi:MAG: hypothetical protein M3Q69_17000 [Acidobacteriota bacterium]|nr:hypothetical protein [Acidobacteriota bacterium]